MLNAKSFFSLFCAVLFAGSLAISGCSTEAISGPELTTSRTGGGGTTGSYGGEHNEDGGKTGGGGTTGAYGGEHNEDGD